MVSNKSVCGMRIAARIGLEILFLLFCQLELVERGQKSKKRLEGIA